MGLGFYIDKQTLFWKLLARVGVEEPALALTEWECRQRVEGSFGFLSLAASRHPGEQTVQLWRTVVVAWGLGHSLSPTVSLLVL